MHAHVPQIFPITNRAQAHTSIPCPFSPLGPAAPSLCLFSFLPLLPSPFSIATLRNVFYAPARSYTHAYNVPTPRTVAQELLDRRVLFLLSPPRCRSTVPSLFFPRTRSLSLSRPSSPFLYLSNGPRFQRGPARVRAPGSFLARACPGVTTRSLDIVSNFPLDFPASSRH